MKKTKCRLCGRKYLYSHKAGHSRTVCNSCMANRHRFDRKERMIAYKGGKCCVCGYNKCNRSLNFHHLDPNTKDFGVGSKHCLSWEKVKKELDKTILLCTNCHMEVHDGIIIINPDGTFIDTFCANKE